VAWHQLIGFALAVTPIMLTAGLSAMRVVQRVAKEGRGGGFRVAAGTACGLGVHGLATLHQLRPPLHHHKRPHHPLPTCRNSHH